MEVRPEQPPEGRLIAAALERSGLSIREASRRAGISYGRWRQIATGVQNVSPGQFAAVRAPAKTLAAMARAAGVTPDEMETEGQRPDAADEMRQSAAGPVQRLEDRRPRVVPELAEKMRPLIEIAERYVARAEARYPGQRLTGAMVFPDDPADAMTWDDVAAGRTHKLAAYLVAAVWQMLADDAAQRQRGRVSG